MGARMQIFSKNEIRSEFVRVAMKKMFFKHNIKSYLLCSVLGIAAGLLVAFFSRFPHDDLWAFALFSSQSFGFWICTCSLIALFADKNYSAGINVALYVYFMFYVTGIFKRLAVANKGYSTMSYFYNGLWQGLAYGLLPAAVCFVLAFALWYGRGNKPFLIALRFLPFVFIAAEAILNTVHIISVGQGLFMTVIDIFCAFAFLFAVIKASDFRKEAA